MADSCARASEPVPDARGASDRASRSFALPDDVLVCAFELLVGLSDLMSAAGVSRQFYAAACRSGLRIHRYSNRDVFNPKDPHLIDREAASWNALVDHALQKGLPVGFTVLGTHYDGTPPATYMSALRKLLGPITRALPILVSLSMTVEVSAYTDVCDALQEPAPRLRSLCLRSSSHPNAPLGPIAISTGLFSGNSPMLRELGLDCRLLGQDFVPAFSGVVRLSTWCCRKARQVPLARHFPKLRHLMVSSGNGPAEVPPRQLDLSRTRLRSLVFHDDVHTTRFAPPVDRTSSLPGLPVFHCLIEHSRRISEEEPLGWPDADGGALAVHIPNIRGMDTNIRYAASDGTWRRSYVFTFLADSTRAYAAHGVVARLEYLRLAHFWLWDLARCTAVFQTLRRLRVDVSGADRHDGPPAARLFDRRGMQYLCSGVLPTLRCPVLASVAILWYSRAPAEPVMLDTASAVILGRALGAHTKPVLELGDLDRERPLALSQDPPEDGSARIEDVFSSVRRVPCAFGTLVDQFDGDLWNDNVAVKSDRYLSQSLPW